jgi:hypothetical protein
MRNQNFRRGRDMGKNSSPAQKVILIVSIVSKIWFFAAFALFIVAASGVLWLTLYLDLLVVLFALNCLSLVTSIVLKVGAKVTKSNKRTLKFINSSMKFSLSTGIVLFFLFATYPTLSRIVFWEDYHRCRNQITMIAGAVEQYIEEKESPPEQLSSLVDEGYLDALPRFMERREYDYAVFDEDGDKGFSVACPEPEFFSSRRSIFSKGTKYVEIKYIQGEGLREKKE